MLLDRNRVRFALTLFFAVLWIGTEVAGASGGPKLALDLRTFHSRYVWNEQKKLYELRDRQELERIISKYPTETRIKMLVDCMSDDTHSQVKLNGTEVPIGLICYEGLTQTIYYEPKTIRWPGYLRVPTSKRRLVDAQRVWRKVIRSKSYIVL